MKFSTGPAALVVLGVLKTAEAHTAFTTFFLNGVSQNDGTCVRMNSDISKATFPVRDLSSDDMACGFSGTKGVARVCPAESGAQITFEFRDRPDETDARAIDPSHKGPCSVYMKKVDSAIKDTASGDGWFKIWDESYDSTANKWCTEKVNDDNGHLSVNIPKDIAGGYYLVRPELVALHAAADNPPDPQFYTGCAQIYLQSNGTAKPTDTVSIPGYVKAGEEAMTYNVWDQPLKLPYPMYGPPAYKGSDSDVVSDVEQEPQNEGFKEPNTVLESGNWCATELEKYSDEKGCWDTGKKCWNQNDECWKADPPTGGRNCKIWEQRCHDINDNCRARNFNGPPNHMKILTPEPSREELPAPRPGAGGVKGSASSDSSGSPKDSPEPSPDTSEDSQEPASNPPDTYKAAAKPAPKPKKSPTDSPEPSPTTSGPSTTSNASEHSVYTEVNVQTKVIYETVHAGRHRRHASHKW
ncbi:MAG: hypothetical protein M1837_007414 [Sclerophora amabilis]|nr:MAG: hypothetical protein M1837_007414 [Sclerophora amabilis]